MKRFESLAICSIVFLSVGHCLAGESDDTERLVGDWRVVDLIARGKHDSGVSFRGMRFKLTTETVTTFAGAHTPAGKRRKPPLTQRYTVDNSRSPKHLNLIFEKKGVSLTMKSIYKIQDGKLHICMGGVDRPTTFDTAETARGCYIAERETDENP